MRGNGLIPDDPTENVVACDDFEAQLLAATAGLGLAYLPTWVTDEAISAGNWSRCLMILLGARATFTILRTLPQPPAKLAVFSQALQDAFKMRERMIDGRAG